MKRYELERALMRHWETATEGKADYTPNFTVLTSNDEDSDGHDEEVFRGPITLMVSWDSDWMGKTPIEVIGGMGLFANFIRDCPPIKDHAYTPSSFGLKVSWEHGVGVLTLL